MDPNIYALVLDTLNRATSQDTEVLKPAEKKLQEWEVEPGFYSVLLVSANKSSFPYTWTYLHVKQNTSLTNCCQKYVITCLVSCFYKMYSNVRG